MADIVKKKKFLYLEERILLFCRCCLFITLLSLLLPFLIHYGWLKKTQWFLLPIVLFIAVIIWGYLDILVPYEKFKHLLRLFNSGHTFAQFTDSNNPFSPEFEEMDTRLELILNSDIPMSASKRQAQYLALQNQINPHFLYNTLEGIRGEALSANCTSIATMCEALSTFFRYTISQVQNLVSLREELDNTKNYFFIQQYRFGPRLSLQVMLADDCEKEAMEIRIPKLTLQPIVENAIIHGLECKLGEGIVRIKIEVMDSRLLITVSDNGVGMEAEQVVALRHALSVKSSEGLAKKEGGIALENVNHRIKLLFGERYGLDITSCIGVGTDVMISLPRSVPKEVVG